MTVPSIAWTLLIAAQPFGERLPASKVAAAIENGIREAGLTQPDVCELPAQQDTGGQAGAGRSTRGAGGRDHDSIAGFLRSCDFDARMKAARAILIATPRLDERTLLGSICFEIATRARQSGVPAYAITAKDEIDRFDARILDLQVVLQARGERTLRRAGRELAQIV